MVVFDIVGVLFVCDIELGELLVIDVDGVWFICFVNFMFKGCVFEYVYLVWLDSMIVGWLVYVVWVEIGC